MRGGPRGDREGPVLSSDTTAQAQEELDEAGTAGQRAESGPGLKEEWPKRGACLLVTRPKALQMGWNGRKCPPTPAKTGCSCPEASTLSPPWPSGLKGQGAPWGHGGGQVSCGRDSARVGEATREPAALEASGSSRVERRAASTDLFLLNASGLYQQVIGLVKRHPLSGQDQRGHAGEPVPGPATAAPGPAPAERRGR